MLRSILLLAASAALAPLAAQQPAMSATATPDDAPDVQRKPASASFSIRSVVLLPSGTRHSEIAPPGVRPDRAPNRLVTDGPAAGGAVALARRIDEERQRYRQARAIGTGLLAGGVVSVLFALGDWAGDTTIGMSDEAAGALVGGAGLMLLGADRHRAAREALERAEAARGDPGGGV